MPREAPDFALDVPLLAEAFWFAAGAHARDGRTPMEHPEAVARLLEEAGYPPEVVAAGLLHDVVEDTGVRLEEIGRRFDAEIEDLVGAMTEDPSIEDYEARKAEHRARVAAHSREAAAIYAADKLAKVRHAREEGGRIEPRRLAHYEATLAELRLRRPDLPLLEALARELGAYSHA